MQEEEEGEWTLVRTPSEKDYWRPSFVSKVDDFPPPQPLKIKFNNPASHWTDAIPIGNGRLGAMVWGGVVSDTLNLNEDTLWTGNPHDYTNPNAPAALSEVRELVDAGKYAEATAAAVKLSDSPSEVYQFVGDVKLEFDDSHAEYNKDSYKRELDLDNSVAKVTYSVGDVVFTREHFVSFPDQVIVLSISSSKSSSLSFTVCFDSKLHHESYSKGDNRIIMEGSCPGKRIPPRFSLETDNPKGIQFTTILDVQISNGNGSVTVLDNRKLKVVDCDWAVMKLVVSSSFEGPFVKPSESKKDPTVECLRVLDSISRFSFNDLYNRHLDDYQSLFHRVSFQLSNNSKGVGEESTADRVKSFGMDEDPSLVELLFQFGRYLLISCSRPGTQVANLQGVWNKDIEPPWDGAQHLNINLQMNYWPSLPCNLRECQEPLFDYISNLSVNGSKTAKVNYEAGGWVAHQVSDIWAKTSPDRGQAVWALWQMGGAWLCTHLWEHYSYTMDKEFLEHKAYPLIEGCALFLLDWLIEGQDGFLETNPSTSPEHMFIAPNGKPASVSYSSTMDIAIIKEIFSIVVNASEVLGKMKDDLVGRVLKAQIKLPPTKIARDGSIMEWALDFQDPEVHHRHVSHLFGLFPGHTITPEKNPDLCKAADYTLFKRGEEGPGWSTTWKTALWARLRNSENAYKMVKHLFMLVDPENETAFEGGVYSNLFTAHPPFQIDANFGFSAAVAEMIVQSTLKDIYLLPALPREKWANGCVKGLKVRGGTTINVCWKEGNLHQVGIWSKDEKSNLKLNYRGIITVVANALPGIVYTFDNRLKCINTYNLSDMFI